MDTISNIWNTGYKQLFGVSENYYDDNTNDLLNMPVVLLNNITNSVSDAFSSLSSMTFSGKPAKKSGKMMALKSSTSNVTIPKFLSSDDNGNLSLFDLDAHTTKNDFSAASLTSLTGNINVAAESKLCIGSTCVSENDLKQLLLGGDIICTYKPSQVFNIIAKNNVGKTFKNVFTKALLPASEQATVGINWGTIVTETLPYNNAKIKQTIYQSYGTGQQCRYSKNTLNSNGGTGIFTDDTYKTATAINDLWEPFTEIGTPFIHGHSALIMNNWKLTDTNDAIRFIYSEDKKTLLTAGMNEQKFIAVNDGRIYSKKSGYIDDAMVKYVDDIRISTPEFNYKDDGNQHYLWAHKDNQGEILVRWKDDNKFGRFKLEKILK